jgi:hypothetical protein
MELIKDFLYDKTWENVKDNLPSHIEIETVSKCNRSCSYCPVSKLNDSFYLMPEEQFKSIIDDLARAGYTGNLGTAVLCEPLLDKRCLKLFSYAKEKLPHSKIHLATNGDLLKPDRIPDLLDKAFTTIRITQHDAEFKHEKELGDFLSKNPHYGRRVSILRPKWKDRLLNWAGVFPDLHANPYYAKKCPFYELSAIDSYGNVLLCCNDAYFARIEKKREYPGCGNIKEKPFTQHWEESKAFRKKLFEGTHIIDNKMCQKCTGCNKSDYRKPNKYNIFVKKVLKNLASRI